MKRFVFTVIMLASLSLHAREINEIPKNIIVENSGLNEVQLWIVGTAITIEMDSALLFPCYPGEVYNIQTISDGYDVPCGEKLEVTK